MYLSTTSTFKERLSCLDRASGGGGEDNENESIQGKTID